jgi:uncharacterized protein (TIGR02266 family)
MPGTVCSKVRLRKPGSTHFLKVLTKGFPVFRSSATLPGERQENARRSRVKRKNAHKKRRISKPPAPSAKLDSGEHQIPDSPRTSLFAHVDLHTESNFFSGFSGDLSDGGLFVATYEPLSLGQAVLVELSLPGGHFISASGRVAWLRDPLHRNAELAPGAGIVFDACDDVARLAIERFMTRREPTFVDPD